MNWIWEKSQSRNRDVIRRKNSKRGFSVFRISMERRQRSAWQRSRCRDGFICDAAQGNAADVWIGKSSSESSNCCDSRWLMGGGGWTTVWLLSDLSVFQSRTWSSLAAPQTDRLITTDTVVVTHSHFFMLFSEIQHREQTFVHIVALQHWALSASRQQHRGGCWRRRKRWSQMLLLILKKA